MDQVTVLWRYSGYGSLTQGHMDIHIVKRFMLTLADSEGKIWLSDFVSKYFNSESGEKRDVMREDEQKRASEVGVIRLLIKPECYNVYRQFFL